MQRVIGAIILGLTITSPVAAQTPNVQQLLQGLTTGNQTQDQALRDAFERGYQKGRQDEARMRRSDRRGSDRSSGRDADEYGNGGYGVDSGRRNQPYDDRGTGNYNR